MRLQQRALGNLQGQGPALGGGKPRIRPGWVMDKCTEGRAAEMELETLAGQKLDIIF